MEGGGSRSTLVIQKRQEFGSCRIRWGVALSGVVTGRCERGAWGREKQSCKTSRLLDCPNANSSFLPSEL